MNRVALMPSAYLPSLGGVEEATRHLALELQRSGDAVEVWTGTDDAGSPPSREVLDGVTVRRFPMPLPAWNRDGLVRFVRGAPSAMRAMRQATRDFRPGVVHVFCFGPNGVYASALSRLERLPLVVTLQGETVMDDHHVFEHSWSLRRGLRAGLRQAEVVTGCSRYTLGDAEARFGLAPGKGRVVFNAVDLSPGPAPGAGGASASLASLKDHRYVLALGRVVQNKGFDLLLRAFAALSPGQPDVLLVLGGEGSAMSALQVLADDLGVGDRVRFPGRLSREQVAAVMADADVLVVPSRLEPFGIVVLEGWRAGTAVVVTARGGPPEFVDDGATGLVVDPFDTTALAGAVDRLLTDHGLRARIGEAGRAQVSRFGWPKTAQHYRRLYEEAASRRTGLQADGTEVRGRSR